MGPNSGTSDRGLSIGPIRLDAPIAQAALAGYSDAAMRRLAREYGCPYMINEVLLDKLVGIRGQRMRRMLAFAPDEHPLGAQLMGSEPEQFAAAAEKLVNLGYDAIDINFGCPVRKVLGRCRGGFLLSVPGQAREIVRRVCEVVAKRVPVTVKMRRGMDDSAAAERDFFTLLDAALAIGVAAVTVHARTVRQRYVGPSDWAFLKRVKQHVGERTIIGSGDLFTAEDCRRMLAETGVNGCSIARGAVGNPFIFREVRELLAGRPLPPPPSISEQRQAIERHLQLLRELYGEEDARRCFVKFGVRYSELHPCSQEVKMAFIAADDAGAWQALLARWYGAEEAYPPVVRRPRPESLIAAGATWASDDKDDA
jgi:nifR3 family TIM-barrel protein